jgi:hypothetical protein
MGEQREMGSTEDCVNHLYPADQSKYLVHIRRLSAEQLRSSVSSQEEKASHSLVGVCTVTLVVGRRINVAPSSYEQNAADEPK